MKVTPHPAFVSHVRARRGALDFAPKLAPCRPDAVWEMFRQIDKRGYWFTRVKNEEEVRQAVLMANRGKLSDDLRVIATAERVMWRHFEMDATNTLVQLVANELGVAKMVEMKLMSSTIGIFDKEARIGFDEGEPAPHDASFDVARAIVCRADDASYAAARDFAAQWRASRPVAARILADFLFPSETAWANADLDEINPIALTAPNNLWGRAEALLSVTDDAVRTLALLDQINDYACGTFAAVWSCDVAVSLPPVDAMRVLCKLFERCKRAAGKTQLAVLGAAMCALEGEEMAAELAGLLLHSPIGPLAVDYFKRFPDLARAVLPKVASGTSKAADAARSILAGSASEEDVPVADAAEVPTVLREKPWRKRKKPKPVKLDIVPLVPATAIVWDDGEREKALAADGNWYRQNLVDMTANMLHEWEQQQQKPADIWVRWGAVRGNYRIPEAASLREWNTNPTAPVYLGPLRMLAVHGDAALPGLFKREAFTTSWNNEILFDAQLHAVGKESAAIAAHAFARRKAWKKRAQEWLTAHAPIAAAALLPVALGADSRERKDAEAAVRFLARTNRAAVDEAARTLGAEVAKAAVELVDRDPLTDLDVKGKLPPFVQPATLPFVKTKSGKRWPDEAVEALLEILRSTSVDAPYAGLERIREEVEQASLGAFAWALVQSWILAGAKGTYEWIPYALALIGDDACARRLAPYVRDGGARTRRRRR